MYYNRPFGDTQELKMIDRLYVDELNSDFAAILTLLAEFPEAKDEYTFSNYINDREMLKRGKTPGNINYLRHSLELYQDFLIKKEDQNEQVIALHTVKKLKKAISIIINEVDDKKKYEAILAFDKQARNSSFSKNQIRIAWALIGGLIGLCLAVSSSIPEWMSTGAFLGGIYGNSIVESQEKKACNSTVVSDIEHLIFQRKAWSSKRKESPSTEEFVDDRDLTLLSIR
ncbi:MAG: hypothetical protein QM652_08745 [Legionella sp.]|uniref:hypothetical protein n=1 Tax=Legionella sp. TaxID=459 RepID=UPI0039E58935